MTGTPPAPPRRVVLLSGDRHFGALYRETDGRPYPLTELTSSGINRVVSAKRAEAGPNRLGDRWIGANVGRVSMDWETGSVALALADVHGGSAAPSACPSPMCARDNPKTHRRGQTRP